MAVSLSTNTDKPGRKTSHFRRLRILGDDELDFHADDEKEADFEDGDDKRARRKNRSERGNRYEDMEKLDRERTRRKARREKRRKGDLG